jgi:hypothetical protein
VAATIRAARVSNAVNTIRTTERQEGRMKELNLTQTTGGSLCLFDERGRLIGTIDRPVQRDPLGPGRATVYLARAEQDSTRTAAA